MRNSSPAMPTVGKARPMKQTPVHEHHNPDLLRLIAPTSTQIIEIGCGSGALAREFKRINPACHYLGIDIDEEYARLANRHCDQTSALTSSSSIRPATAGYSVTRWNISGVPGKFCAASEMSSRFTAASLLAYPMHSIDQCRSNSARVIFDTRTADSWTELTCDGSPGRPSLNCSETPDLT